MKLPHRRHLLRLVAGAAALPALARVARAQAYPSRPVTLVVFVPAGGTPDIIARLLGQALTPRFSQSVVIDNRPGGGGNLALQAVARAPADGYTLLMVATPHAINVTLYEKSAAIVTRDIVPVAGINNDSFVLLTNPSFAPKTVAELIAYAKANPGKINAALADPSIKARMADLGSEPIPGSIADFSKLIADETEKWAKVVKFAGLKAD
jgi:tripartite-type tricarboxylate transporter receptor subunit TctC